VAPPLRVSTASGTIPSLKLFVGCINNSFVGWLCHSRGEPSRSPRQRQLLACTRFEEFQNAHGELISGADTAAALARSAGRIGTGTGRRGAIVALVLGPIGLVIGGLVVATAEGGLGTGHGLGGGILAMMVGLIGMALGGLALARSRRTGRPRSRRPSSCGASA